MELFTTSSRRVLSLAHQAAERLRDQIIDTEHLLLGLLEDEDGVAGRALRKLGLSSEKLEALIKKLAPADKDFDPNRVELSAAVQTALEHSVAEALRLGENSIDTEYLLLGLVQFENRAMAILEFAGVTPRLIREQIRQVLIESGTPSPLINED
jgi:ATP-dependent Clp protease ATP-binding subunit ClpC